MVRRRPAPAADPHQHRQGERRCGGPGQRIDRWHGLRDAHRHPARGHLLQQGPVQTSWHRLDADDDRPSLEADVAKLKTINVAPIAVGAKDAWPAAHWYYNFALRECSPDTLAKAPPKSHLSSPIRAGTKAGDDLTYVPEGQPPSRTASSTTPAQQGRRIVGRGLVANHKCGHGTRGQLGPRCSLSLTPNQQSLPDLGWFPFPTRCPGATRATRPRSWAATAAWLSKNAPKEAFGFLEFLVTKDPAGRPTARPSRRSR